MVYVSKIKKMWVVYHLMEFSAIVSEKNWRMNEDIKTINDKRKDDYDQHS